MRIRQHELDTLAAALHEDVSRRLVLRRLGGGLAALAVVGGTRQRTSAQDASPVAAATTHRFSVGAFEVIAVSDGAIAFPNPFAPIPVTQVLFADAPPDELAAALREAGLEEWVESPDTASATLFVTPLVIDTGQELVLIDTGIGAAGGTPDVGRLPASLASAGIAPGDVDLVVISHAHSDHILGTIGADGAPVFPNARYVMGRVEHAFWTDEARVAEVFADATVREQVLGPIRAALPIIGSRLELIDEAAEVEIVPGLRAVAAYGHTPGHTAFLLESEGERLIAVFDTFTHPLHVAHPTWSMAFDTFPNQTDTTRRGILDRAAAEGMLVHVYHFPFPGLGRVSREGDAWRWEPTG